jgi:hypothetical protein
MIYQWKNGARPHGGVAAQDMGEWLERLRNVRPLDAGYVKEAARPPESPGHAAIFWKSVEDAAEAWYEEQAEYVLRSVVVINEDGAQHRAFLNVVFEEESRYEAIQIVMSDAEMRDQVLTRALKEAKDWQARYRDFQELFQVFAAIEQVSG